MQEQIGHVVRILVSGYRGVQCYELFRGIALKNHTFFSIIVIMIVSEVVVIVASSPHQSPWCGVSRFRSALSITIPLSVRSASISPAH